MRRATCGSSRSSVAREKRKAPHGFVFYGDNNVERLLRGGDRASGCDPTLEYPAPAGKPTYSVVGSDKKKRTYPYYDEDGVPLPYHDAAHCPNYCASKTAEERAAAGQKPERGVFAAMSAPGADASPHELDPPGMHCPPSHPHRVVNVCTN